MRSLVRRRILSTSLVDDVYLEKADSDMEKMGISGFAATWDLMKVVSLPDGIVMSFVSSECICQQLQHACHVR